jgi:dimethylhistidine N-methyltransferase
MMSAATARNLRITDEDDVLSGLYAAQKRLPSRLLFDAAGVELFAKLSALDDYYPARIEAALLRKHLPQIALQVGANARVVELGSGDPLTTRMLLRALERPNGYVPIDLAGDVLKRMALLVRHAVPGLEVQPLLADYTQPFELPSPQHASAKTLVVAPRGTLDTLEPGEARALLARLRGIAGPDRLLLVGADGTRDIVSLERAYDDAHGATAAFDKNVLAHLNRTRGATFDLDAFDHRAVWNADASRLELQLVSTRRQSVRIGAATISFEAGESIVTERNYKHTPPAMQALLAAGGWRPRQVFTSSELPYRLWLCESSGDGQDRFLSARRGSR